MKRIILIGCPGSGKSTFSKALHQLTGIPLFHLDILYWNADKTTVTESVFRERLSEVLCQSEWIIDGNYSSTMELRMQACDTVIFLDYPLSLCLEGINARKGQARSDLPWIESTEDDEEFLAFIKSFNAQSRPQIMELLKHYSDKNIFILQDRAQADQLLNRIRCACASEPT